MSLPRLGYDDEIKGFLKFNPLINQKERIDSHTYKYEIIPQEIKIEENEYFQDLFENNKISVEWKVTCETTLVEISEKVNYADNNNYKPITITSGDLNFDFSISWYLVANTDFILISDEKTFDPFFDLEIPISKGSILSNIGIRKYDASQNPEIGDKSIIVVKFLEDNHNPEKTFTISTDNDQIFLYVNDKELTRLIRRTAKGNEQKNVISRHAVLHQVLLKAFIEMQKDTGLDQKWARTLQSYIGENTFNIGNDIDFDEVNNTYYKFFMKGERLKKLFSKIENIS
jgi:hypothetical protein